MKQNVSNICSPLDNASFGTFWVQIGRRLDSLWFSEEGEISYLASSLLQKCQNSACDWAFKDLVRLNNWPIEMHKVPIKAFFNMLQILIILCSKIFYSTQTVGVKYSFIAYVCSKVDMFFVTQYRKHKSITLVTVFISILFLKKVHNGTQSIF